MTRLTLPGREVQTSAARILPLTAERGVMPTASWRLLSSVAGELDLDVLVRRFLETLGSEVPFDGACYHQPALDLRISLGSSARHRLQYRLKLPDAVLGEVELRRGRRFREDEISLVEEALALVLHPLRAAHEHSVLMRSLREDHLTGLLNRKALDDDLERELGMVQRYGGDLSVVMLDLDDFKRVNDTAGHAAGDALLKEAARVLRGTIRATDQVFRFAGDEFMLVMPKTPIDCARRTAERIRGRMNAIRLEFDGRTVETTVSVGVAQAWPGEQAARLLQRVDQALYRAKEQGRNYVHWDQQRPL
ncbi:MAG: GGDEF domain-containing protein [Ectothiorhodospiraceae bacterium]|nr:GGDEF domain-containing protein [Ectothiorhodospiraceae bacterium]MCH8506689.1 GGDEF domain-containing protein [Ectothiorhodospiraceae bacterium]